MGLNLRDTRTRVSSELGKRDEDDGGGEICDMDTVLLEMT